MQTIARIGAVALLLATAAPAFAASDPETDQLFCDLAGQCGGGDAPAAATPAPPAAAGAPRTGATRGFTFKRQAPAGGLTPSAEPQQQPQTAAAIRPRASGQAGVSNLRLNFASGSATLTEADKARLDKLAQVLGAPALATRRTRIEGHTDASGSAIRNRELSRRRAQSVADYLAASGVAASRLEVVGFGASQPLPGVPADSPENRRVMAVVLN
jgi:outer membrane protein OmpA-like peptidoglycan-associated protein